CHRVVGFNGLGGFGGGLAMKKKLLELESVSAA
ncbi:MAG TPA: MGMT family protein, partial [Dehalococcoidia bacterium]|nr:MGMT family protein [Dehalococcoidia bacterium]